MRGISPILGILLFMAMLVGCADTTQEKVVAAISDYNKAAMAAYRTGTAKPLLAYASEKEVNKVQVLVDLKMSNKLVLESELLKFDVLSATRQADDLYSVRTRERWRYFDRSLQVGTAPGPVFTADIFLEYIVRRDGGVWKVEKVKAEKTEYLHASPASGDKGEKTR